jgi:hypothetical protein
MELEEANHEEAERGEEQTCVRCGMENQDWSEPEGYELEGTTYCCQGCADDSGCTCQEALGEKLASADEEAEPAPRPGRGRRSKTPGRAAKGKPGRGRTGKPGDDEERLRTGTQG